MHHFGIYLTAPSSPKSHFSWVETCQHVLNKKLEVWDAFFRDIFLEHCHKVVTESFLSIKLSKFLRIFSDIVFWEQRKTTEEILGHEMSLMVLITLCSSTI